MLDILYSKFCVHRRHSTACRAPPTGNDRAEIKYGTHVKAGANVGSKNGSESVKEPAFVVGLNLLLVLLHQPEGDLHSGWDNSFSFGFEVVRQGDGYCRRRKKVEKP